MLKEKLNSFLKISIFVIIFIVAFFISMMKTTRVYCNDGEMQKPKLLPIYRLWSPKIKDHLLTTSAKEKDMLQNSLKWNYEGIEGYLYETQQPNTVPLYRYYNPIIRDHGWTIYETARAKFSKQGYHFESILGYVFQTQQSNTIPLYQFYSNVRQDHFITSDKKFFKYAKQFGGYDYQSTEGYIFKTAEVKERLN